jgi:cytosine/adenosine deaminase-related metal-dependent hydrolase
MLQSAVLGRSPTARRASRVQHFLRKTRMVLTALLNKIAARDPTVFPAWEVLRMATIEGAQAVGLGDKVGSLEIGKQADLIGVDLTALNLLPVLEVPVRQACPQAAQPGLCRKWARGCDGDGRGQGTRARW